MLSIYSSTSFLLCFVAHGGVELLFITQQDHELLFVHMVKCFLHAADGGDSRY